MNLSPAALASAWASAASSVLNDVPSDRMPMSLSPCDLAQFTISWAYWALDGRVLNAVGFSLALNSAKAPSPLTTSACCCIRYGWIWFCAEENESFTMITLPCETSWRRDHRERLVLLRSEE